MDCLSISGNPFVDKGHFHSRTAYSGEKLSISGWKCKLSATRGERREQKKTAAVVLTAAVYRFS
jgi:hypothetical protein